MQKLSFGFRAKNTIDFEELPREVQLAKILRFRGVRVDRLHLIIQVPFEAQELDVYEKAAIHELQSEFGFTMLEQLNA